MNLNETIKQHFTRDSIVDMLTRYELYYQISLGNFVLETIIEIDETMKKLEELNLQIEPNIALSNIFELILHNSHKDNFEDIFEYHLRSRAMMHSLKDFVNKDTELLNSKDFIEQKSKEIIDDKYFNEDMKLQLDSDYNSVYDYYDTLITQEIATQIQNNLK
ncbi:MAG: hypothetical protein U9N59_03600 [Campylobacterota bacterium]|nr:hypothetical protein [Campylobacterota bacterium]